MGDSRRGGDAGLFDGDDDDEEERTGPDCGGHRNNFPEMRVDPELNAVFFRDQHEL